MKNKYLSIDQHGNMNIKGVAGFLKVEEDYADFEDGDVIPCFVLNYFENPKNSVSNGDEALLFIPAYNQNDKSCSANFVIANIGDLVRDEHKGQFSHYFVLSEQSWCNVKI
jgi:hypothetical protein